MSLVDLSDIAEMLAAQAESLCSEILPSGRRHGNEWVEASTKKGGLGDGLKVCLSGSRRGIWKHFGDAGSGGDMLELVAYVLFSGDKKKAVAWAKNRLGLEKADPDAIRAQRQKARAFARRRELAAQEEEESRRKFAKSIWHNASPNLSGSPADSYYYHRGIILVDLPKMPGALRFAPRLKHPDGRHYAGIVAQINGPDGQFMAVHRTFLSQDGHVWRKASLGQQSKMVLGPYAGGFISLNRGISSKPFGAAPEGDKLIICEGIEDGLSLALACPEFRVIAAISVSNFKNLCLPATMSHVVIAADNDPEFLIRDGEKIKHPARCSLEQAVGRFVSEGRDVFVARSPAGKDFNDCLRDGGSHSDLAVERVLA